MSASYVATYHEAIELLRWDGTALGITRILTFIAEKGYEESRGGTGAEYVPVFNFVGGGSGGNFIRFIAAGGAHSLYPGEWIAWSAKFELFSMSDDEVGHKTDLPIGQIT